MRTPFEKNTQPVARTLSESLRDARYACAIQTFKSDAKLTLDFLVNALVGFVTVGIIGLICYLIVTML
jgi:ABC-type tungstate transport system substrate-binding protein